jgi:hypothetical protein
MRDLLFSGGRDMRSLEYLLTSSATLTCGISPSLSAQMRQEPPKRRPGLSSVPAFVRVGRRILCRPADLDACMSSLDAKREG